ncbi:MAG TPA: type II toxin-antitoxin system RelE/ParE family toxin [Bdellovibrionales bacterium]|nr:type II toxin-antitoxin system mRNA interferase toxin, RelE/StbE family [Pseudobdellovibrionaceae bacterium]HAG91893.1 type II toxin-antitoxin system RelE/ParE family toxin [Bdellovibrionales bacterium]|tara:strand:+ start:688 stop:960 length:273 start_codon:yes stop_codon:yes gene_type:complete
MNKPAYQVVFKKSALKELNALPSHIQQRVLDAAQLLSLNPYTELLQIKKLKGADSLYRFRLGDYRVIYTIEGKLLKITVIKFGHRREVYR